MKLKITRKPAIADQAYGLKIFVDGQKIGKIFVGETKVFTVPKHSKTLYGKLYWAKTKSVTLSGIEENIHLEFRRYETSNPLIFLGITGYPLEIIKIDEMKRNFA